MFQPINRSFIILESNPRKMTYYDLPTITFNDFINTKPGPCFSTFVKLSKNASVPTTAVN